MKFLHTSDWHLGRSLYQRKRYDEFSAFLNWLLETIEEQKIDTLLVAGDIFDSSTPSNRSQKLYYQFLIKVANSYCQHIVVIAGNHDSPSFLNAPKELLHALNVFVVGEMTEDPEDEIIILKNTQNKTEAIICAVPYLRDKELRTVAPGENADDKVSKLIDGLKTHYADICQLAELKQKTLMQENSADYIPIVGMGHLFTSGGKTVEGDGVRELYVGSLAHIGKEEFPSSLDYLALGHLHVPQCVGATEHIRYSGSPIPMGYGEAKQDKKVVIFELNNQTQNRPKIEEISIPCFQQLIRVTGSLEDILNKVNELKSNDSSSWLEIEYTGQDIVSNLREILDDLLENSSMEIRRIKNKRMIERIMSPIDSGETLDDLDENEVFVRCLDSFEVPNEERPTIIKT
jgi:exonuclease SbcD